ncbi:MAG: hypothetical protein L6R42_002702 [Xanthoria sp. 1 TBL-2021]|nr:MAG: hypothetical protein L6R42_002702 [Xanthoria sp. 1 TBL-2021]
MAALAPKVLITGSSGFVGFRTLVATLEAGYRVLGAVPRREDADHIHSTPSIKRMGNLGGNLTFITVPDIAADQSLAEAIEKDVEYIIHTDSPMTVNCTITADRYDSQTVQPLLKGTNNVLSAALGNPSIKRVVMTSSLMAIAPYNELFVLESFTTFNDVSPIQNPNPPYENAVEALCAGKGKALAATNTFLAKNKPHFTVINLMPGIVIGHNELAKTWRDLNKGSNKQTLRHLLGEDVSTKLPSQTVFVDDVAKVHALALKTEKVAKTQNFLLSSGGNIGRLWYRALEIIKKEYMDAVKKGWLSLDGEQPINRVMVDDGKTEKVFNIKFAGFDKQIRSLLDQWVQLKMKAEKEGVVLGNRNFTGCRYITRGSFGEATRCFGVLHGFCCLICFDLYIVCAVDVQ